MWRTPRRDFNNCGEATFPNDAQVVDVARIIACDPSQTP
jgi:hypothetical protein